MILCFTYHKVRPGEAGGGPEFYTVCAGPLIRQIKTLAARGHPCLALEDLLRTAAAPNSGYLLSFDDGTSDHYELVFPLLQQHGLRAIFFIPTSKFFSRRDRITASGIFKKETRSSDRTMTSPPLLVMSESSDSAPPILTARIL